MDRFDRFLRAWFKIMFIEQPLATLLFIGVPLAILLMYLLF